MMAQQDTQAAGGGQPTAQQVAAELRRQSLGNLSQAKELRQHVMLLRDHMRTLGAIDTELDDAFTSALVALGAEAYAVEQQGLELAKHADSLEAMISDRSVHDTVLDQTLQPLAVGTPGSGAAGGDAPVVVEVYALGSGVAVKGEGGDLPGRQCALELEAHGKRIVFDPLSAGKTDWKGPTVKGDVRPVILSLEAVDEEDQAELGFVGCTHEKPPLKTAILSLPQGFGKSTVAHDLARWLGCTTIVEEWSPAKPVVVGALHLTNVSLEGGAA